MNDKRNFIATDSQHECSARIRNFIKTHSDYKILIDDISLEVIGICTCCKNSFGRKVYNLAGELLIEKFNFNEHKAKLHPNHQMNLNYVLLCKIHMPKDNLNSKPNRIMYNDEAQIMSDVDSIWKVNLDWLNNSHFLYDL